MGRVGVLVNLASDVAVERDAVARLQIRV